MFDNLEHVVKMGRNTALISQLNKLLAIDPNLTKKLVNARHSVSQAYTESEEFVYMQESDQDIPVAGFIGVLNGLVIDTVNFRIAAIYNDCDELIRFSLLELQDGKFVEVI